MYIKLLLKGEIMRLMREERGESRVLMKAFSFGYQKGVGEPLKQH